MSHKTPRWRENSQRVAQNLLCHLPLLCSVLQTIHFQNNCSLWVGCDGVAQGEDLGKKAIEVAQWERMNLQHIRHLQLIPVPSGSGDITSVLSLLTSQKHNSKFTLGLWPLAAFQLPHCICGTVLWDFLKSFSRLMDPFIIVI